MFGGMAAALYAVVRWACPAGDSHLVASLGARDMCRVRTLLCAQRSRAQERRACTAMARGLRVQRSHYLFWCSPFL